MEYLIYLKVLQEIIIITITIIIIIILIMNRSSNKCRKRGWTPRSFQISVYSSSPFSPTPNSKPLLSTISTNCSWIEIISFQPTTVQFVHLLSLRILPSFLPSSPSSECTVSLAHHLQLPVHLQSSASHPKYPFVLRWFERPTGNTRESNGDSAWTNYYHLYQYLSKLYGVDIVQADEKEVGSIHPDVCLCFSWECGHPTCSTSIYIVTEMNKVKLNGMSFIPQYDPCSISFNGKKLSRVRIMERVHLQITSFISINKQESPIKTHFEFKNDRGETVALVGTFPNTPTRGWFGIGQTIDDMHFFSSVGHLVLHKMIQ